MKIYTRIETQYYSTKEQALKVAGTLNGYIDAVTTYNNGTEVKMWRVTYEHKTIIER